MQQRVTLCHASLSFLKVVVSLVVARLWSSFWRKLKFDTKVLITVTHSVADLSCSDEILSAFLVCLTDYRLECPCSIKAVMMPFTIRRWQESLCPFNTASGLLHVNKMNIVEALQWCSLGLLCPHCRPTALTTSRFCCAWTALICTCAEHTPSAPHALIS